MKHTLPENLVGGCHCKRVTFSTLITSPKLVQCNCSICVKKGFLHLIVEPSEIKISGLDHLSIYKFNTKKAAHYYCPSCGIHILCKPKSKLSNWSINARCIDNYSIIKNYFEIKLFDGINWETAIKLN